MDVKNSILEEYDNNINRFEEFIKIVEEKIDKELKNKIKILPISSRVKERESLSQKIDKKNAEARSPKTAYKKLGDITDIAGVRIITFHDSDVLKIGKIIRSKFIIDRNNSVDKRQNKTTDFGYKSLHYVISLNFEEYVDESTQNFKDLKVEVQIRTILQHAWAEIQHDLGYKNKVNIPLKYRRSFSRLSALLEMGDMEFDRLRKGLSTYREGLYKNIENTKKVIPLDQDSLAIFIGTNTIFEEIKEFMRNDYSVKFVDYKPDAELIERLEYLKIYTISGLRKKIIDHKEHFERFVKLFLEKRNEFGMRLKSSSPLYYFAHYLASSKGKDFFEDYRFFGKDKGYRVISNLAFDEIYEATL